MSADLKGQEAFVGAPTYIKDNFEPSDRIAILVLNRQTRESRQRITTAEKASSPEFQAWLRHRSARGDEIYVGMNALKPDAWARTKDQVAAIRHLYVDLDHGGERAVEAMQVAPATLAAFLGPCIGGSVYEVGAEVRDAFCSRDAAASASFAPKSNGKWLANLPLLARQRLTRAGLLDPRIAGGAWCTFSDPARFYSYRRDGASGRMAALIWRDA